MKRIHIATIESVLMFAMFIGCSPAASSTEISSSPLGTNAYQVEIINLSEPVYETIRTESIDQPNCYGTGDVDNVVERTMGINHSIELGLGLTVDVDGKLELFGTGVDLGAAISSELGYQYGITESITRSITVRAAPNTHMVHEIELSEVWESGTARVTSTSEAIDIPFRFRANFSIDLIESVPVICPTGQATTAPHTQQDGLNCSFIDELITKADVIQNLYEGQSLAGVQARLISSVDVPAGWIVQKDSNDYYGPVHFDSGTVASFWSPNSCRPLDIESNSTDIQPTSAPSDSTEYSGWVICWHGRDGYEYLIAYPESEVKNGVSLNFNLRNAQGRDVEVANDSLKMCFIENEWYGYPDPSPWFPSVSYMELGNREILVCSDSPGCQGNQWTLLPEKYYPWNSPELQEPKETGIHIIDYKLSQ